MSLVTDPADGLFPRPHEIKLACSCPDWADMCKHLAAVLYGVGNRLDTRPDLLFLLRGVDPQDLISTDIALPCTQAGANAIPDDALAGLFGISLDLEPRPARARTKATVAAASGKRTSSVPTRAAKKLTGVAIRSLRKRIKMSQDEFAVAAGVSVASVKRWEANAGELRLQSAPAHALQKLMDSKGK